MFVKSKKKDSGIKKPFLKKALITAHMHIIYRIGKVLTNELLPQTQVF
jgi:hypothetical protein